jgi:hypothetical protein
MGSRSEKNSFGTTTLVSGMWGGGFYCTSTLVKVTEGTASVVVWFSYKKRGLFRSGGWRMEEAEDCSEFSG